MPAWFEFLACAAVIGVAGFELARNADAIAERTKLGGTWIGMILLATVTSLPELVTAVSAVTVAQAPDVTIGDVLGSCVFNLAILAVAEFFLREEPIFVKASQSHIISGGFGVILLGIVAIGVLAPPMAKFSLAHIGLYTPVILVVYAIAARTVFVHERRERSEIVAIPREETPSLRRAAIGYGLAALFILAAGLLLPFAAVDMAREMGWHTSFVGSIFVAISTSLPEMAATAGAIRLRALDLAVGNLLGSNLFNIVILAVADALFLKGPILAHVSGAHAVSAVSAMVMTGAVIVGLRYRPVGRVFRTVGWVSVFLLLMFGLNTYLIYVWGR